MQDDRDATDPGWLLRRVRDQRLAFLLVGVHNTVTLACSHVVSVIVAFVLYRTLVFRVTGQVWRDLVRFESVYLVSLGVNWVLLNLLTVVLGLPAILAQALVVSVIAVVSFFGHKHFSFRRPGVPTDPPEHA